MYTKNPAKDALLFVKAFLSNQLARFAPKLYVRLTRQTGRGAEQGAALQVANYFIECFNDYRTQLGLSEQEIQTYLKGKIILEYGPGDIMGVALLCYAYGAKQVHCVDKFPLSNLSKYNIDVYCQLLNSLEQKQRERAEQAFIEKGKPASGFNENIISYQVTSSGLSGVKNKYDLIISRAVLEHVNDLEETMLDIKRSMKVDGKSIHQVDLKSHGLDRYTDFDFLTWPEVFYRLMYNQKGFPNRWRVNKYRELAENSKLDVKTLTPTEQLNQEQLKVIASRLAKEFRKVSLDELSWQGFWMHLEHTEHT